MRAVSLSAALELDARFARTPNALPASFGDGFLCKHNFVYRNIRNAAVAAGFDYTTKPPFWYEVLPLLSLAEIYRTRLIPYHDTRRALQDLERAHPKLFTLGDLRSVDFRRNHVMHESVHCVVRSLLEAAPAPEDGRARRRLDILDRLIGESAANAAETLGNAPCDADEHREMYAMNTFMPLRRPVRARLLRVLDALGFERTSKIVFFGYLFSNFLYQSLPVRQIARDVAPYVELPGNARTRRAALLLFRRGFELSIRFRVEATGAALKQAGYRGSVFGLLDFDFMQLLARCETRRRFIDDWARFLERGVGALPLSARRGGSRRRSSA
jgi:hypothetical protein